MLFWAMLVGGVIDRNACPVWLILWNPLSCTFLFCLSGGVERLGLRGSMDVV